MSLTILIAPSGFKESLGVQQVTRAIAEGVLRAQPDARILSAPMVDGGEGTVLALVEATNGSVRRMTVTGPLGEIVQSYFGILGGDGPRTAVVEMAAAAGLSLVPRDRRDPTKTTSYGVGELIRGALDAGVERILIGCGDSGVNDGGLGMAQALGARMLDAEGRQLGPGGAELARLAKIDLDDLDPRLAEVSIDAAVNWHNALLGPKGVARVFGPQKGATAGQVVELEAGLVQLAQRLAIDVGAFVADAPGAGASGGLGAAILGILGGTLHPRYDVVMQYLAFDRLLAEADLVITAEGAIDGQTPYGKIPAEVGRRAKCLGVPVIALAGSVGEGCADNFEHGIDAFASILKRPCSLEEAISEAPKLLIRAAEDAMRMVDVGRRLDQHRHRKVTSTGFSRRSDVRRRCNLSARDALASELKLFRPAYGAPSVRRPPTNGGG